MCNALSNVKMEKQFLVKKKEKVTLVFTLEWVD